MSRSEQPAAQVFLEPTPDLQLNDEMLALWDRVVRVYPTTFFAKGQEPMLATYVRAAWWSNRMRRDAEAIELDPDVSVIERAKLVDRLLTQATVQERMMLAAGRSLRITNQAQRSPDAGTGGRGEGRRENPQGPQGELPWEDLVPDPDAQPH